MRMVGMTSNWPRRRWTRVLLALVALGWLAAAALSLSTGQAHAAPFSGPQGDHDQYAMWEDIIDFAPSVTASDAGAFAQRVCGMLNNGNSEGYLVSSASTQYHLDPGDVRYIIHMAEWHYCPEWY
jgi:hypothetical protein